MDATARLIRPRLAARATTLAALMLAVASVTLTTVLDTSVAVAVDDRHAQMVDLANGDRAAAGLAPLARAAEIDAVALAWAQHMADTDTFEHNPDFADQIPDGWRGAAENIAAGHRDPAAMQAGWMRSDGHRRNLLGDFTHIGVAFVDGGKWGTYGVQVFAKYPADVALTDPATGGAAAPAPAAPGAPGAPGAPAPNQPAPPAPAPGVYAPAPEDPIVAAPAGAATSTGATAAPGANPPPSPPAAEDDGITSGSAGNAGGDVPKTGVAESETRGQAEVRAAAQSDAITLPLAVGAGVLALAGAAVALALFVRRRRRGGMHTAE